MLQDVRHALRSLRRTPAFTIVSIVTLALGIGANTAMFSVLNTYLFRPLPYPSPHQLVRVYRTSIFSDSWPHSAANFLDFRDQNAVLRYMVATNTITPTLVQDGALAERLLGMAVTGDFFAALGVNPALGRVFGNEEDRPGSGMVVVLSDRFWRSRFGADPTVVGQTMRLDGERVEIIGVMPRRFEYPLLWGRVDLWRPMAFSAETRQNRGNNYLQAFARLRPDVDIQAAQESLVALAASVSKATTSNQNESLRLAPLQLSTSNDVARSVMWLTLGLAGFVLLIACANLANLQLGRSVAQTREHSVRAALGASRSRLIRLSLAESLLLACLGGALSLLIAVGTIAFINRRLFADLAGASVTLDLSVFGFALVCSVLTGLAFGTVPAWLTSRADVNQALKESPRGSTSAAHRRLRHALIVGEVSFALVLLTGAGLFLRGLERFSARDHGWSVDGLLTAQVGLRGAAYETPEQLLGFYRRLQERLEGLPGVQRVALSNSLPIWGFNSSGAVFIEGTPDPEPGKAPEVFFEQVSLDYFDTFGIRLVSGRTFASTDVWGRPEVVIVNETMARRLWPNEDPLGKRIARRNRVWMEVVGVVNDVAFPGTLAEPYTRLQAFRPLAQAASPFVSVTMRTSIAPEALEEPLRRAIAEVDPGVAPLRVRSARRLVETGLGSISLLGTLLGAFAALGLLLAAVGIYGVTSYSVVQRTSELGIRMALGARTRDVLRLVLGRGAGLIALGGLIGSAGAYAVGRFLSTMIPTLPTRDPAALTIITLVLLVVALAACFIPARRAARLDPLEALRHG